MVQVMKQVAQLQHIDSSLFALGTSNDSFVKPSLTVAELKSSSLVVLKRHKTSVSKIEVINYWLTISLITELLVSTYYIHRNYFTIK